MLAPFGRLAVTRISSSSPEGAEAPTCFAPELERCARKDGLKAGGGSRYAAAMATNSTGSGSSSSGDTRAPPAVLLNPATFVGALAVFVIGSLIVKAVWPSSR